MTEPNTLIKLISLAKKDFNKENYNTAIIYLNNAIEIYPNNDSFYESRGDAKQKLEYYQGPDEDDKQAVQLKKCGEKV